MAIAHSSKALPALLITFTICLTACGGTSPSSTPDSVSNNPPPSTQLSGVLMWKGDNSAKGLYAKETTLTTSNVNSTQFGKLGSFTADGYLMAQPLYISQLDMGASGVHNVIILATENDSVYAIDADNPGAGPLWQRSYLDAANGVTVMPDNFGGRTTLGGKVGITGTPVVDPKTAALYFVTTLSRNGVPEQWLRSIDVRSGKDFGAGGVKVQASVAGDGKGSVNGQIAFDPSNQNQRAGLVELNGKIIVAWGSFSDWGVYHGWLMAFDASTLKLDAVFNSANQNQPNDVAFGPSDHGGGAAFWQGGAAPAVDSGGNIFINTADGSFNADSGGTNYGDTLLKLQLTATTFQVMDSFTPFNANCINPNDLELGSSGVAILPTDFTNGNQLAVTTSKEGRLFLINMANLGKYNSAGDNQIPQELMVGDISCSATTTPSEADGTAWDRLYGTASYWNGNIYAGASNLPLKQYQFSGGLLNSNPVAQSPTAYGVRGGNSVISANGTQNAIVWAYEKASSGSGILHAYDATSIATELWNSQMNSNRDALGGGIAFCAPVAANGKVIVTYDTRVGVFGELP